MRLGERQWLVGFALVIPTCVLVGSIFLSKHRKLQPTPPQPPPPGQKALIEKWRNQDFESFQSGVEVRQFVERFRFLFGELQLSDVEKQSLTNAAVDFVTSYQEGTLESITKWRIPAKRFRFSQGVSNVMAQRFSVPPDTIQNNPEIALKKWWYGTSKDSYSNLWIGISITNCEVRVEKSTTTTNELLASLRKASTENVGYAWSAPSIIFEDSPEHVFASNGSIYYATIRILPKTKDNDSIYPVYLRLYWSSVERKWLPESMLWVYSRSDRKNELFF